MRIGKILALPLALASYAAASTDYPFDGTADTTIYITNSNWGIPLGVDGGYNYAIDAVSQGNVINAISQGGGTAIVGYAYSYGNGVYANGYYGLNALGYDPGTGGEPAGVYTRGVGGDIAYGIIADAYNGNSDNWSGWFNGKVYSGGGYYPSDIQFKKNVQPLQNGLSLVLALRPKTYDMKVDEFKGRMSLPEGKQYGLIAQELEQVIPELVTQAQSPVALTPEERKAGVKKEGVKFKAVDYTALIPILIEAIQEQQAQIEALKKAQR